MGPSDQRCSATTPYCSRPVSRSGPDQKAGAATDSTDSSESRYPKQLRYRTEKVIRLFVESGLLLGLDELVDHFDCVIGGFEVRVVTNTGEIPRLTVGDQLGSQFE